MALDTYSEMAPARETEKRKEKLEKLDWKQSLDLKKIKIFCAHAEGGNQLRTKEKVQARFPFTPKSRLKKKMLFSFSFSHSPLELSDAAAWGKEKNTEVVIKQRAL